FVTICMKTLAKKPADRYVEMAPLVADLDGYLRRVPPPSRPLNLPNEAAALAAATSVSPETVLPSSAEAKRQEEQALNEQRRFAAEEERKAKEQQQRRQVGEAKLAHLVREALDRTGGRPNEQDVKAANETCRQYHVTVDRAQAIVKEA